MNRQKVDIIGAKVDLIDMKGALKFVADAIENHAPPRQVITLNAEIIYRALTEPELLEIINNSDLVTPDGAGVVWAARYLGNPVPERVTGIDLLQETLAAAQKRGWRLFFFGGAPGIAHLAKENIMGQHQDIKIVGTCHGYLNTAEEEEKLLEQIQQAKPDILLVALGAPRQEYWIKKHKELLQVPVNIGVGGSFDVLAGKVNRAPEWIQKLQLEWLHRLIKEPFRYKRMLALPKFMLKVIGAKRRL